MQARVHLIHHSHQRQACALQLRVATLVIYLLQREIVGIQFIIHLYIHIVCRVTHPLRAAHRATSGNQILQFNKPRIPFGHAIHRRIATECHSRSNLLDKPFHALHHQFHIQFGIIGITQFGKSDVPMRSFGILVPANDILSGIEMQIVRLATKRSTPVITHLYTEHTGR